MTYSSLDDLITDAPEILVTHIDRTEMLDIIRMRNNGLTVANIAGRKAITYNTLRRYIRVYDQYGIEAFKPDQVAAA